MPTRKFIGRYENLAAIGKFVSRIAQKAGFDAAQVYAVQLAVDEACTNIIEHGYGGEGLGEIECACNITPGGVTVQLRDWSAGFNPEDILSPNYTVPLEQLKPRGAGLYLMRQMMDDVQFSFDPVRGNLLTMKKRKTDSS